MHPSVFHSQWTNVYMYSLDFHRSAFIFFMFGAPMTPPQDTTRPSSQHLGESMFKKVQNTRQERRRGGRGEEGGAEKSVRNRPANSKVSRRRRKNGGGEKEEEEKDEDKDEDEDEEDDENEDEDEDKDKDKKEEEN